MTRHPSLHLHHLLAVLALAGVMAACGDDGDGGDGAGSAGSGTTDAPAAVATDAVAIEDFSFEPARIRVRAGSTVTWTNKDDFAHTVTAEDETFDSMELPSGKDFPHTFESAGTFAYLCTIHPYMKATVTVE